MRSSTKEQYKKNQAKTKFFKALSPIVFWLFIILSVVFFCLAIKYSVGNITEIINLLDKDIYSTQELEQNYSFLVDKWGEWAVIGQEDGALTVYFINIKNAFFSGLMKTFLILSLCSLFVSIFLGRVLFPRLALLHSESNQNLVDLATLETNEKLKRKDKEDWF